MAMAKFHVGLTKKEIVSFDANRGRNLICIHCGNLAETRKCPYLDSVQIEELTILKLDTSECICPSPKTFWIDAIFVP
jgi:hypothetical protein